MRWLEMLVAGIFTFQLTHSALMVALVSVARTLPQLLTGALVGVVGEAVSRQRLLMVGLVVIAVTSAILSLLAFSGAIQVWQVALGAIVSGTVASSEMAVRRRMIGDVVPVPLLSRAVAFDSLTGSASRMIGPLVGGVAFEALGIGGAYLISALLHLVAAVGMSRLEVQQARRPLALARIPSELAEGLAIVRQRPILLAVVVVSIVTNMFGFSYSSLIAPFGIVKFDLSPALVGLLASAEPIGAIAGGVMLSTGLLAADHPRLFIGGSFGFLSALIAMALSPWFVASFVVLLLGGLGTARYANMQTNLVLTDAPSELRSRVMGMVTVAIGTAPLGVLTTGLLSTAIGPALAIVVMAAVGLATLALVRWRIPALRR